MNIAIIGDGNVGSALQRGLREGGHAAEAVDAGPLRNARYHEPLGVLNIQLGYGLGMGTEVGFRLVH